MQLWVEMNLHRVAPGFPEHVRQEERAKLVGDFAAMNMEDILRGGGQGP